MSGGDYNMEPGTKKGASVISDAINLLSNAWDDSKTQGNLPRADHTTYNLAIVTGNQETEDYDDNGTMEYNGGLENLPRFHEKWSGKTCTINGAFVNLWTSKYANGLWMINGDRYKPPHRNWNYDPDILTNMPPFPPMSVTTPIVVPWQ